MIEQMTHVAVLGKAEYADDLLKFLYGQRSFHVMPLDEKSEAWSGRFAALPDNTQDLDAKLNRINSVVAFCQEHCSKKPSFLDTMLPLKVVGTKADIAAAVAEANIDTLYKRSSELRSAIEAQNEKITRLQTQKSTIEQFAFLGDDLPKIRQMKHFAFEVVSVSGQGGKAFLLDSRVGDKVIAQELFADQTHVYIGLIAAMADVDVLKALIDDHGLHVYPVPEVKSGATQEIAALADELAKTKVVLTDLKADAAKFADAWLRKAGLAAGHWESEKNLAAARLGMSESSHLFAARGYVKTDALELLTLRMENKFPGATVMPCEAPAGEDPPISLKWNKWISPAGLLVKMYGLPAYNGIDPTPFVASIFFLFVGICLGDAVYGLILIGLMLGLKSKYREQAHLQDFFQVFVYCGFVAMIIGCLTGSFMGDVSRMVPGLEKFNALRERMTVIDPIQDSQTALYIAIGIGVLSQLYGMAIRTYKEFRRGDTMAAFSDGILWMCFLVFVLLGAATTGVVSALFWSLFIATLVALILTQGRDQKGWFARIMVGVISLYGIVGAYGASAVLGDLISYARLMALSLTSAALGSTFNMLADLAGEIAVVGGVVSVIVIIGGHTMNFFLGLLGAFVHSARLVMLEFFGRFYDSGGYAYKPYGFESSIVDEKKG